MICSLGSIYIYYAYNCVLLLLSCFSRVRLCGTPWTSAYQVPPSMGFSRQEYWSGLPLPSPNPVYETAKETLMYRTVFWTLWERERVGRFGRMALKHVKCHVWNEMPVQVQCTMLDAWGWCTGTTQRDGRGREEGEGFRMGNTCTIFLKLKLK